MTIPTDEIILNRYKVVEELGRGGFGITYKAIDLDLKDKPCAVKQLNIPQLPREAVPKAKELFDRECQALMALEHPQIPRILAYKAQDNDYYIVQEFIDGWTLDKELKDIAEKIKARQSYEPLIQLLIEILEVLSYVHASGIIHRDIKPQNLMRRKADGKLILIDFGVVKRVDQELNNSKLTVIVSGEYTPPEQKDGEPCYASDIYALGVVGLSVLRLLTNNAALTAKNLVDLNFDNYQLAEEMKYRFLKMLHAFPEGRYHNASETLKDFLLLVINNFNTHATGNNPVQDTSNLTTVPSKPHNFNTRATGNDPVQDTSNLTTVPSKPPKKSRKFILVGAGLGIIAIFLWLYRCWFFAAVCDPCLSNPSLCGTPPPDCVSNPSLCKELPPPKTCIKEGCKTETPWLPAQDKKGLKAEFKIVMLVYEYRWVVESDDAVEEIATSKKLALSGLSNKIKPSIYSKIDNPNQIISVGAASCEGDPSQEETRAASRANKIHTELAAKLFTVKTYRMLNLGQHRVDKCDPKPEKTSFQRAVIMIGVRQEDKGVDVDQALKNALISQAPKYVAFDLNDYSLGSDKNFKTDICDKEGSCNNPLLK
jgi:eukaryotic-like serine/threonine-protein kinase